MIQNKRANLFPSQQQTNFKQQSSGLLQVPKRTKHRSLNSKHNHSPCPKRSKTFQTNIGFPTLQSLKSNTKMQQNNYTPLQSIVRQQKQQNQGKYQIKHVQIICDHDQFNQTASNQQYRRPRGKSFSYLNKVEENRQQQELPIRQRKKSRIQQMIDKNQFNQQQTGIPTTFMQQNSKSPSQCIKQQNIDSITEIQEGKEGLTVTLVPKSNLSLIVDQVDKIQKRQQLQFKQIEQIQEIVQQRPQQHKQQPLLRVSIQKLQQQKQLMKKILKSQTLSVDTANLQTESTSILTEPIKQQLEEHDGQDFGKQHRNQLLSCEEQNKGDIIDVKKTVIRIKIQEGNMSIN